MEWSINGQRQEEVKNEESRNETRWGAGHRDAGTEAGAKGHLWWLCDLWQNISLSRAASSATPGDFRMGMSWFPNGICVIPGHSWAPWLTAHTALSSKVGNLGCLLGGGWIWVRKPSERKCCWVKELWVAFIPWCRTGNLWRPLCFGASSLWQRCVLAVSDLRNRFRMWDLRSHMVRDPHAIKYAPWEIGVLFNVCPGVSSWRVPG